MMDFDLVDNILRDIWGFQLALFGISVTLYTVTYSFILSKRDELRIISNEIKISGENPSIIQRKGFCIKYISYQRKLGVKLLSLSVLTFSSFIMGWIMDRFIEDLYYREKGLLLLSSISVSIIIYFITMYVQVALNFQKHSKV